MSKKKLEQVSEWSRINIDTIAIPDRLRLMCPNTIEELAASFAEVGLLNPITVRPNEDGGGYILVAGRHRWLAAQRCEWKTIHCIVKRDLDADKAELAEIDENLIRAELSPAERALHVDRRKAIYEKLHPETKHGGDRKSAKTKKSSRQVGDLKKRFTKDTAGKTGQSERSVQRDASRGENVAVLPDIVGTSLDQGAEIDALAKLPVDEQRELAARARSGEKVSAKQTGSAEISTEDRQAAMAELSMTPEEKAAKASAKEFAEFSFVCHARLPKMTPADQQKARLLVSKLTSVKPKAKAA